MYNLYSVYAIVALLISSFSSSSSSFDQGDIVIALEFHSIQGSCFEDAQGNPAVNGHTQTFRVEYMAQLNVHDIELINVRLHPSRGNNAVYVGHYVTNGELYMDFIGCGYPRISATPKIGGVVYPEVTSPPIPLNDRCC